jgi:hypothetical protein
MPERLLDEARRAGTSPTKARLLAQVAVAIEVQWHAPLRLANLVALNLQQNIQAVMVKGEVRWIIRFDRHETKNRSLLGYELPAAAVRFYPARFLDSTTRPMVGCSRVGRAPISTPPCLECR